MLKFTKFFEKLIRIYCTKCIPYKNIHCEESSGNNLVFYILIFFVHTSPNFTSFDLKKIIYTLYFGKEGVYNFAKQSE
jgi:hypothetical protein